MLWLGLTLAMAAPETAESVRAGPAPVALEAPEDAKPPEVVTRPDPELAPVHAPPADMPVERDGPPFYTPQDAVELRRRFGLTENPPTEARTARWHCLIADPTCGFNVELNATSAYALRAQQRSVDDLNDVGTWHSARAQYDLWVNFATVVETVGRFRYTRMTLGPKGGIIASDSGQLWGNFGLATRYWFGRGKFAPALEITTAISFRLTEFDDNSGGLSPKRSPAGFTADVGLSIGGFGALVVGGQYDSPLAREEVPEDLRVQSAGMFFVGFRGNMIWGAPAAAAVATHIAAGRSAGRPQ
jgi:hypothetical protein